MTQNQEHYWPQHKVFFIATLALFPTKLNGHEVNQWFYKPYFVGETLDHIEVELEEYRKNGYLQYEKIHSLYKISAVDTEKAASDLRTYIKKWQHNELLSLPKDKSADVKHQQTLLVDAITRAYTTQKEPRITPEDVYGKPNSDKYKPPFWELVLSYHLLDKKVKIKYMDYDRRMDGLYDDNAQPVVDFKIVDKELINLIQQKLTQIGKSGIPTMPSSIVSTTKRRAWLTMPEKFIFVELENSKPVKINKYELRTDLAPYSLMKRLLEHPTIPITLEAARKLYGCEDVRNLSEVIRQCGFNEVKKKLFFEISTAKKVKLRKDIHLSPDEVASLT